MGDTTETPTFRGWMIASLPGKRITWYSRTAQRTVTETIASATPKQVRTTSGSRIDRRESVEIRD